VTGRSGSSGGRGVPSRDDLARLPVDVRARLRDTPRHFRALQSLLASTEEEQYANAARSSDPDVLTRDVYPLERAFEIISAYVIELAKSGVVDGLGLEPQDGVQNLRRLAEAGAIARSRAERLIDVHRTRNNLVHQYPDVRARLVFQAAAILEAEIGPFMREYTHWFIGKLDENA
jgi:uncharacterized protein YutE (UPF0331/DUF86 family)